MFVGIALVVLSLPVLAWTTYLATLTFLSRVNPVPPYGTPPITRFDVVVPAHNEELGILATVLDLLAVDYPAGKRRVIVVADNCSDATARIAADAGAIVIERNDPDRRGKGYALARAFERSLADGLADAVVVVDADTKVSPNLLLAFDARLRAGAGALQADYRVANPRASWRTRLMHIGFTLFHDVRSRGRERLRLSAGLRGNGMAFASRVLREVPHDAYSLVEDVEYGIRLGRGGYRVHYVGEAHVFGEMVTSSASSRSQRRRWEGGRLALVRRSAGRLLADGARLRSPVLLDLAADLLVPPLTYVVLATLLGAAASTLWFVLAAHRAWWAIVPWSFALVFLALYIARGAFLARVGPRVILDLMWAPVYIVWKVALAIRTSPSRGKEWVRTTRQGEKT